jgi:hypothetical protein
MTDTPKNLTGAINRARELHREEIADRLRRRQELERQRLEELNALPTRQPEPAPEPVAAPEPVRSAEPPAPEPVRELQPAPRPTVREPSKRPRRPVPAPVAREDATPAETLPTERFVKIRNSIFDELSRYLSGNQYKVYLELYRETLGRKNSNSTAFFRPRQMAADLGIGSDQTVYRAFKELQERGLISVEAKVGHTQGSRVTVRSLEVAMEALRQQPAKTRGRKTTSVKITTVKNTEVISTVVDSTTPVQQESPHHHSENHDASVVNITTLHDHERHVRQFPNTSPTHAPDTPSGSAAIQNGGGEVLRNGLAEQLVTRYDYSPHLARIAIDSLEAADLDLVPLMLTRLDGLITRGRQKQGVPIQNPAGILSGWLADFDSWRAVLEQDRARLDAHQSGAAEPEGTDLYVQYLTERDARTDARLRALDPDDYARRAAEARREIIERHPPARDWPDEHWAKVVASHLKGALADGEPSFDEWLASRSGD